MLLANAVALTGSLRAGRIAFVGCLGDIGLTARVGHVSI